MTAVRTSSTEAAPREQIGDTRQKLRQVAQELKNLGVNQKEIADRAGWKESALSNLIGKSRTGRSDNSPGSNTPPEKMRALMRALYAMGDQRLSSQAHSALKEVAERYGTILMPLAAPVEPIAAAAPNFIPFSRPWDLSVRSTIGRPGSYAVDGTPMCGRSTALQLIEQLLREAGITVCHISARDHLRLSGYIAESDTGVVGAVAARMESSTEPLQMDHFAVDDVFRRRLASAPKGYALLIDDVDDLPRSERINLTSLLRSWTTYRSGGHEGFATSTTWGAHTSNVEDVTARSILPALYHVIPPFEPRDLLRLAEAYATSSATEQLTDEWVRRTATSAFNLFAGQPYLSHAFIHDRSMDGLTEMPAPPFDRQSPYMIHLRRVAELLVGNTSVELALRLIDDAGKEGKEPHHSLEEWTVLRLRICRQTEKGLDWSSQFYRKHLPQQIERAGKASS